MAGVGKTYGIMLVQQISNHFPIISVDLGEVE